ncbi:AT-rich interactive domain-containing protein 2-like [Olea europaea var. sylvestris]|uniref:AT-rich interactive domain-containing protein 2-like n=1 Tax=Olea europaea var. sylvestris TaxID=158386 RepID=UPI000C1D69DE|nr:AT-rich interactive domain-containing protein 2-like [Olea europaea var. sylvestris]
MEGCSNLRDDSLLHEVENAKGKVGFGFDLDFPIEECRFDAYKERLRSLFDQLLVAFMREKSVSKCIRPLPALCDDGQAIDLFKLFWVVWKIGGYSAVSRNKFWRFVVEECGLSCGSIPSLKLIYMKYLNELDQWLRQVFVDRDLKGEENGVVQKLELLCQELKTRFCLLSSDRQEEIENDVQNGKDIHSVNSISELHSLEIGRITEGVDVKEHFCRDEYEKICNNDDQNLPSSAQRVVENVICEMHDDSDRSINHDFAAAAKRIVRKVVNEVHGFSKGQIDYRYRNSCLEDDANIVISAKKVVEKVIEKVRKNAQKNADDEYKKFSALDNDGNLASAKKVVETVICNMQVLSCNITEDVGRLSTQNDQDAVMSAGSVVGTVFDSQKRKRESQSVSEMLNWLIHTAKHSDDPAIGKIPESSNWKDQGNEELWFQSLLVHEALLVKRHGDISTDESVHQGQQKKLRMHPSMYEEDNLDRQASEKVRCSKRASLTKSLLCSCCNAPTVTKSKVVNGQMVGVRNGTKESVVVSIEIPPLDPQGPNSCGMPAEKQVSVGPLFQAGVPEWTGFPLNSDSKWLGTKMWSPEDGRIKSIDESDPFTMGRQHKCYCRFPHSVECVRFHIAEKRFKLKHELGSLFYHWRFDRMGEEVSLSWTKEEEKRFKDAKSAHASVRNKFWNNASRFLPTKTLEKLVSYYFNVFLVQRRSYQNRATPNDINSDDDEKGCGSVGDSFGCQAVTVPGWKLLTCTQNNESADLA